MCNGNGVRCDRNIETPVGAGAADNPLNIVRRIFRPGDFISFKLDIDNAKVEQALMDQLDTAVVPKIAEFFFEQVLLQLVLYIRQRFYFCTALATINLASVEAQLDVLHCIQQFPYCCELITT